MAGGMKRLAKETAIYGVSSIVGRFLNWLLVPMYTRVLADTAEYGIVTNLYAWIALLMVILTYGMETGFFRFMNRKEEEKPLQVYSTTLTSLLISSTLFSVLLLLFIQPISITFGYANYPEFIGIMGVTVAIDAFCTIPFAYLRYQGKATRFAILKLINIFLFISLNLFFLILCPKIYLYAPETISWFYKPDYGVGYVFVSNAITTFLTVCMLWPDIKPALQERFNFQLFKQILTYSLPILALGVAGIFNQTADKILFPFLFEDKQEAASQLGIYGACFKIAVVMVMFIQAFRYAYEPFIFAKNKSDTNTRAYSEAMKYFIIFSLLIFLGVMFYLDILKYLVSPDYYPGLKVVPIVMAGELCFGIYFNLSFWYKLIDQTKWGAYFSISGCIITVGIILFFGPTYGYMACAWASFICNFCMMLASYFIGQHKYPISYDLKSVGIYFGLATLLYIPGMYIPLENEFIRLGFRTLLLILFLAFIIKRDLPLQEIPYLNRFINKK